MTSIGKLNSNLSVASQINRLQKVRKIFEKFCVKAREFIKTASPIVRHICLSFRTVLLWIIRINYMSLIAALLLVMTSEAGMLDNFPALQWLAGAEMRLWNWFSGLFMNLSNWIFENTSEIRIPILSDIFEWAKYILLGC